jgi:hypothetical protein
MTKFREPSFGRYYADAPQVVGEGYRSWITRSGNFAIVYTEADAGAKIGGDFVDEHFVYIVDGRLGLAAGGDEAVLEGESLAIFPPGRAEIEFLQAGAMTQVITQAEALVGQAANAAAYAEGAPELAPADPWPMPAGGYRLRTYALPYYYSSGGLVNAFRTRKLMLCPYPQFPAARDVTALTPHSHADFEQASVALEGDWIHHLRTPWTPNMHDWRPDDHAEIGSPSTTIIPAGVVHTSRGVAGAGTGWRLLDVFGPPRVDFSQRPGVVRNADEYPMPRELVPA